jgi:hypothetical protein
MENTYRYLVLASSRLEYCSLVNLLLPAFTSSLECHRIVGILHMLFSVVLSVAPFRSFLDPNYPGLGLRFLRLEGMAAVVEVVLPQIDKLLESPEEKRLRRIRAGVVSASIGLGAMLVALLLSLVNHDFFMFIGLGLVPFFIGLGILINGLAFTLPRKELADNSSEALAQKFLDLHNVIGINSPPAPSESGTNELDSHQRTAVRPSVTEHTTHQLKPGRS